jgi:hypothetical protein
VRDVMCIRAPCPPIAVCVRRSPLACPRLPIGSIGICSEECSSDNECPDGHLCCSNGCGHVCTRGVTGGIRLFREEEEEE